MSALRIAHPGSPTLLVKDVDPFAGLTQRQRFILEVVQGFGGNRSRAARHLGISTTSVQCALRLARRAGAPLPPAIPGRLGRPDLGRRVR